jgi:hypothetical protein
LFGFVNVRLTNEKASRSMKRSWREFQIPIKIRKKRED